MIKTPTYLINELSNINIGPNERIKDFNFRFNKKLNKAPTASRPGEDVCVDWYISVVPSSMVMFVDRAGK